MKVKVGEWSGKPAVTVRLSERNLLTLSRLWEEAMKGNALPVMHRFDYSERTMLTVVIEADEVHYKDREPGIGPEDV